MSDTLTGHLYTPRVAEHSENRLRLMVSDHDIQTVRQAGKRPYTVTDLITGKRFLAKRAPCGLGCRCDAVVVEELSA